MIALRPLHCFVSKVYQLYWSPMNIRKEAADCAPQHAASSPRLTVPIVELPATIQSIVRDEYHQQVESVHMLPMVANNPLWRRISRLPKDMYVLFNTESSAALLVVLHDSGLQLVLKTWSARRAASSLSQVEAELDAAKRFAWHPLMATLVAACYDSDGNFCSMLPYAGCSLRSIISHPDWFVAVSAQDRLEFTKHIVQQHLTVLYIMLQTGNGHYYRDVKPDNVCFDLTTGLVSVIDYGLKISANMDNFHLGHTPGYHAPELANPGAFGGSVEKLKKAITNTTDTFLVGFLGLEAAVGLDDLPWQLQADDHEYDTTAGFTALLREHGKAAAAGYEDLIARVSCPVAQDFFRQVMCTDPAQRPTPAQALNHEWLVSSRAAMQQAVAAATPAFCQKTQQLADMFGEVPGVILPQQPQQQQEERQVLSPSASVKSAITLDVPCSSTASSCPGRSSSPPASSIRSSSSDGDTTAADQLPAGSYTAAAAAAAAKKKPSHTSSLLQRGKKLLRQLSRHSSLLSPSGKRSDAGKEATNAYGVAGVTTAVVEVQGWMDEEPCAVSVPGLCGTRWFRRSHTC